MQNLDSLRQYVHKKGIGYFINNPSKEDVEAFTGTIFDEDGNVNMNALYLLGGFSPV